MFAFFSRFSQFFKQQTNDCQCGGKLVIFCELHGSVMFPVFEAKFRNPQFRGSPSEMEASN